MHALIQNVEREWEGEGESEGTKCMHIRANNRRSYIRKSKAVRAFVSIKYYSLRR